MVEAAAGVREMCDCINKINKHLEPQNAIITVNFFDEPQAFISLSKRDKEKRGKLPLLLASFCPFCGEKYKEGTPAGGES